MKSHISKNLSKISIALTGLVVFTSSAFAHHPTGGKIPDNLWHGLLSGFGHPVIGIDHFAFIIAVGLLAGLFAAPVLLPVLFVLATLGGVVIHLFSIDLPAVETMIAASVLISGLALIFYTQISKSPKALFGGLFALAGLFHGYAYGESIIGAEATPLAAYFAGLGIVQAVIAMAIAYAVMHLLGTQNKPLVYRLGGGLISMVGALFLMDAV